MNIIELKKYIELNYSIANLASHFNKGKSTIRYWLKKYELKTTHKYIKYKINNGKKICSKCKENKLIQEYGMHGLNIRNICKKCHNNLCNSYKLKNNNKGNLVKYKGGKCEICNIVSKVYDIYDIHHKNPKIKEFSLSSKKNVKLDKLKDELNKCHLLCANCHCETHNGMHPEFIMDIEETNKLNEETNEKMKKCSKCKITKSIEQFYKKRNSHYSECKICHNKRSGERMILIKQQCVDYKGGKCQHCGYNKYIGALDFHHIDPNEKDYGISRSTKSFERRKQELDKCLCLCKNCHRTEHYKLRQNVAR